MKRIGIALAGLTVASVMAFGTPASAATISYLLTVDHCSGGCGSSPYGQIDLTDISLGNVEVTVTLNPTTDKWMGPNGGQQGTFLFNLIGNPTITVTGLSSPFALHSTTAGSLMFDGFGNFEYAIDNTAGSGGANAVPGQLDFIVHGTGITTASFAELSAGGAPNVFFGAHIFGSNGNTGPVGAVGTLCVDCTPIPHTPVPEPASLVLLGSGLLAATRGIRKFRS